MASEVQSPGSALEARDRPSPRVDSGQREFYIAGVGASAGGLEALETLFRGMPSDTGIGFVVVQHLSPDFKSHMPELLARATDLPVHLVENGMEVQPDNIYLIPPRKEMIISEGRLLLTDQSPERSLTHPIDQFFRSLASDAGRHAVGIILSGTGSDGSRGIREIHEAGGLVLCQSEETAKFDGMPLNAQQSGVVDLVLPPQAMPQALRQYVRESLSPEKLAQQQIPSPPAEGIERIFELLQAEYGIDFNHYKAATIGRRVQRRLALQSLDHLENYIEHLQQNREELHALYKDLLIGVTRFFRDEEAFEVLQQQVAPDILARVPPEEEVRVWCAGCGTGEEAYSLAMLLHEEMTRQQRPVKCKIFATDVHRASLETAGAGVYREELVAELSPERRERYFERVEGGCQVRSELRKLIVFAPHNLIGDAPFTQMDLVTCRNLLIYLQPQAQKKALSLFHFSLKLGGVLFLGPSETPGEIADEFQTVNKRWKIFRKRRDVRLPAELRMPLPRLASAAPRLEARPTTTAERKRSQASMLWTYDRLLDQHMPPSFLIDADCRLLHTFGGAERFLKVRGGRTTTNLLELVLEDLKTPIAGAVQHALKTDSIVNYAEVRVAGNDGQPEELRLSVQPMYEPHSREKQLLVKLETVASGEASERAGVEVGIDEATREHIRSLESELHFTRQNLQTTIEELETANEELQAANEELVASNEELQSTNEELHSVNEELYTVNSEHQKKIDELTEAHDDMDNLLATTRVGVVFLDREMRIRRITPEIGRVFRLTNSDVGRRIDVFSHNLEYDALTDDVRQVLETEQPIEKEVRDRHGAWHLLRILPYRTTHAVEGVVLTLIDIDSLKQAEQTLARFKFIADHALDYQLILDRDGRILYGNRAVCEALGYSEAELLSMSATDVDELVDGERYRELFEQAQRDRVPLFESIVRCKNGTRAPVEVSLTGMRLDGEQVLYATLRDVTQRKQAERRIAAEHAITEVMAEERTLEQAMPRILEALVETLEVDSAEYWAPNESGRRLSVRFQHRAGGSASGEWPPHAREASRAPGEGLPGRIWENAAAAWMSDAQSDESFQRRTIAEHAELRTGFGFPVVAAGEVVGVVTLFTTDPQSIDEELTQTLTVMGREIGQFVGRVRSEEALRLRDRAVSAVTDGIVIVDACEPDQPITYVNEGFTRITGYSADEAIGRNCRFLQGPDTDRQEVAKLRAAIRQRRPCRVTLLNYRKDGKPFWNELHVAPVRDDSGLVTRFVGVQHDITRRKNMEERLRRAQRDADTANAAKSEFLANMSHEIRTPMTAILGFADILLQRAADSELVDGLNTIKRNGSYLLELINDILDLSKIEAGQWEVEHADVDVAELLAEIVKLMSVRAQDKQLPLRVEFITPVPAVVRSDRVRLRQILVNLLSNAIKFTDTGCVTLQLECRGDPPGELRWHVVDTGIGMTAEQQQRLFQPFTQVHQVRTEHFGGTGLGLSISRRLAERLGGRIEVTSAPGEGSTFSVIMPIARRDGAQFLPAGELPSPQVPQRQPAGELPRLDCRVLIADDRRDVWRVASHFLEQAGADVIIAEHGEQAVELIEQAQEAGRPIDLVLMDMQMPVMSGFDATARLRLEGYSRPIIALTAGAMAGDRDACINVGCDDYLAKPIDGRQLVELVARYTSRTEQSPAGSSPQNKPVESPPRRRVLIVDDSRDAAAALAQLLELDGHQTQVAGTGAEALDLADDFRPDFVISDIRLPDVTGYDLLRDLRSRHRLRDTTFIAWSGDTSLARGPDAGEAGFDHQFSKPINMDELRRLLA